MIGGAAIGAADRNLLPEGRTAGPMPWVIAIMIFLTILAAAAGLGLDRAARGIEGGNRVTVQIVEANAARRNAEAGSALALLQRHPAVQLARRVSDAEMQRLLEPWLGVASDGDIPIPAMIEAELKPGGDAEQLRQPLRSVSPSARVDANAEWLAPLKRLISALRWLALGLVLLMLAATAASVVLAARAALDTHRGTIEVLHLMGATDHQVAHLFQRRIARDALFGGGAGLVGALLVLWLLGRLVAALGSHLIGSVSLPVPSLLLLALIPLLGVLLAMLVARATILRALDRLL
ncbi:MAG TPA: FtsX-like permease family protein [Allosphingosinicella sp.]|uniref:cell division protein FtsX n=1 Tax=Allosphingosinicella sp. TaxID=2823234 RepID=UPI002ED9DE79